MSSINPVKKKAVDYNRILFLILLFMSGLLFGSVYKNITQAGTISELRTENDLLKQGIIQEQGLTIYNGSSICFPSYTCTDDKGITRTYNNPCISLDFKACEITVKLKDDGGD